MVHSTEGHRQSVEVLEIVNSPPRVRSGGLFSEATMPEIEEDAIVDPDVFFTLPDLISLVHEQVEIGNLVVLAKKTGLDSNDILKILERIDVSDVPRLQVLRLALGVSRSKVKIEE